MTEGGCFYTNMVGTRTRQTAEAAFKACLQDVCTLAEAEANEIIAQGYTTARMFRRIDSESLKELFSAGVLANMRVARKQNIRALRAWLLDLDPEEIDISEFTLEVLERQCEIPGKDRLFLSTIYRQRLDGRRGFS